MQGATCKTKGAFFTNLPHFSVLYSSVLYTNREGIKQGVETREKDAKLMNFFAFLIELYKPEFWYFEVIVTGMRLVLTGFSASSNFSGSFTQLSCSLRLNLFYNAFGRRDADVEKLMLRF